MFGGTVALLTVISVLSDDQLRVVAGRSGSAFGCLQVEAHHRMRTSSGAQRVSMRRAARDGSTGASLIAQRFLARAMTHTLLRRRPRRTREGWPARP